MSDEQSNQLRDEGFKFLHKSHQQTKSDRSDTKRLIIKMLLEKGGVRIDCDDKETESKFQEFLAEVEKRDQPKLQAVKICLHQFLSIRFIRSKELRPTAPESLLFSIFNKGRNPTSPELIFIDTLISHLQKGHSLTEQLKDPKIQTGLISYPLLAELIKVMQLKVQERITKPEMRPVKVLILIAKFETIRFMRAKKHESSPSDFFSSLFSKNKIVHPELVFIDALISNLQNGISLEEQLGLPEIRENLTKFPFIDELIKNDMKIVTAQADEQEKNTSISNS
jgi:hypothetical protein